MLLTIDHVTRYSYEVPVRRVVQSHRLTPSVFDGQKVLAWDVSAPGGQAGGAFRDGAGDWVQAWTFAGPLSAIEVRVRGQVETQDLAGVLRGHRESAPVSAYLRPTPLTEPSAALTSLAAECRADDALSTAHALMSAVTRVLAYQPGVTHAGTPAAEALAAGAGVCQDHAHVLCSAARSLAIPARYVSGYLMVDAGSQRAGAAHAWSELWIEGLGWVGFDPANACSPDGRHVRLASGLDALQAAPIRGATRAAGTERLEVSVAVTAAQQ